MPERIPELDALAAAGEEAPMLPPSEIRRRGNRRRTRRYLATGAGAAALAIVAAVAVAQSPLLDGRHEPDWATPAPVPTASPTEEAPSPTAPPPLSTPSPTEVAPAIIPPTWANVPAPDELVAPGVTVEVIHQNEGDWGEWIIGMCHPADVGSFSTVLMRDYGSPEEADPGLYAVVLGYPSVEAATDGFNKLKSAAVGCLDLVNEQTGNTYDGRFTNASDEIVLDTSTVDAQPVRVSYSYGFVKMLQDPDVGRWNETTLVQAGARVLWVSSQFDGQDFNCSVAPDPEIQQCERPAALATLLAKLVK